MPRAPFFPSNVRRRDRTIGHMARAYGEDLEDYFEQLRQLQTTRLGVLRYGNRTRLAAIDRQIRLIESIIQRLRREHSQIRPRR